MAFSPFLVAHQRFDLPVFNLARFATFDEVRGLKCISIHDQMIRALMCAQDLEAWLNDPSQQQADRPKDILVRGGGPCGMSVAVELARRLPGFDLHVIDERKDHLRFPLQADCPSRWIDPTQYDWSMDHWDFADFPMPKTKGVNVPFPWSRNRANLIARQWNHDLAQWASQAFFQRIHFYPGVVEVKVTGVSNGVGVEIEKNGSIQYGVFACVIETNGFGGEVSSLDGSPDFVGYQFWQDDPFESPRCGIPGKEPVTVIISGAGDGAVQDFLRVTTRRPSARHILEHLGLEDKSDLEREVHSAEARAERAFNWSSGKEFGQKYFQHLHEVHVDIVRQLLKDNNLRDAVVKLVTDNAPDRVLLVSRDGIMTCQYALNRFLGLLIIEAFQLAGNPQIEFLPGFSLDSVTTTMPPAKATAQDCVGLDWDVALSDDAGVTRNETAQLVIIRHGLERPKKPIKHDSPADVGLLNCPRPVPPSDIRFLG